MNQKPKIKWQPLAYFDPCSGLLNLQSQDIICILQTVTWPERNRSSTKTNASTHNPVGVDGLMICN